MDMDNGTCIPIGKIWKPMPEITERHVNDVINVIVSLQIYKQKQTNIGQNITSLLHVD